MKKILIVVLVATIIFTAAGCASGVSQEQYYELLGKYEELLDEHDELFDDYDELLDKYNELKDEGQTTDSIAQVREHITIANARSIASAYNAYNMLSDEPISENVDYYEVKELLASANLWPVALSDEDGMAAWALITVEDGIATAADSTAGGTPVVTMPPIAP